MYKLSIGIGYSILKLKYLPHNSNTHIMDMIRQHRIILSEKIIRYYLDSTDEEYKDIIQSYLDSIIYTDETHIYYDGYGEEVTVEDEIIQLVGRSPMKVLVSEKDEFDKKKTSSIKLITPQDINSGQINALYRYTLPVVNHIAKIDECVESYAVWFGHYFEGETTVAIIDKYILNANGIECLKKYYLPYITNGTKLNIYCEIPEGCTENDIIKEVQQDYYRKWDISIFICSQMHDRYIVVGDTQISIGAGLDFLHLSGRIKKGCTINITKLNDAVIPKIDREIYWE